MGITTDIEWSDSTVNPTSGCDGCELWVKGKGGPCYAGNLHERWLAKSLPVLYAPNFAEVRLAPGRMRKAAAWPDLTGKCRSDKPWLNGMPRVIFVGDMADIFSRDVPFDYLKAEVIDVATSDAGRRHVWMLLTKQASRAVEFSRWLTEECETPWPENVWSGVSVTSAKTEGRADLMCYHHAATKFLSVEPMLGPVSFARSVLLNYQLVIGGGESGYRARPMYPDWPLSLRDQCQAAGVPFFFKQWGEYAPGGAPVGTRMEWVHPSGLHYGTGEPIRGEGLPVETMARVGKKAAGRLLDDREWNQFPVPAGADPAGGGG